MSKEHSLIAAFTTNRRQSDRAKTILKLAAITVLTLVATKGFAAPKNLVAGAGPLVSVTKWAGKSAISAIPGASLFPTTSKTTALYIAFTEGQEADIHNMVLYQTDARSPAITSVTPVTLNGVSNPTINLQDTTTCPDQPVSVTAPCIIELDKLTLQLSTPTDSYLAIYFTTPDTSNDALGLAKPSFATSGLTGWFESTDQTNHLVGDSLNTLINSGRPFGLIAVMNK